jgi:hypothetical protein
MRPWDRRVVADVELGFAVKRLSCAKQAQAPPSPSKQKRLDLLGFIRPNRDLTMGYSDSK